MASHPKDTKNPRFGHLPLSTSGPEECALTVTHAISASSLPKLTCTVGISLAEFAIPQQGFCLSSERTQGYVLLLCPVLSSEGLHFRAMIYIQRSVEDRDTDLGLGNRFQATQLITPKCPDAGRTGEKSLPAVQQPL